LKIHDNPELNYKEFIAYETLTRFLKTRKGWKVTPSAYGIATAFIAEFDSGKKGPLISYNAEYGANSSPISEIRKVNIDERCT
jgi:metal-dependent amidase/aminoacylase/carboxypeptidase family protein